MLMNLYSIYVIYSYIRLFGQPIETNDNFWMAGFMFYMLFLVYNQNNPVRFVKIMKLYSQGKVRFKEEGDSIANFFGGGK